MMNFDCRSAPITTAWSQRPLCRARMAAICAQSPDVQAFETTTGSFGLRKKAAMRRADQPGSTSSRSAFSRSSSATLPFVVESRKSTRGEEGSIRASPMACDAERRHMRSNPVYFSASPEPKRSPKARSTSPKSSSEATNGSGIPHSPS